MHSRFTVAAALAASLTSGVAWAQSPVLDEVRTITADAPPAVERTFEVTVPGSYRVLLADQATQPSCVQNPACPIKPLKSIRLAVTRASGVVATLVTPDTLDVDLTTGTYVVRVVGAPDAVTKTGDFRVLITRNIAAAETLLDFSASLTAPPPAVPPTQRRFDTVFTVDESGALEVTLRDFAFPVPLASADIIIVGPPPDSLPLARFRPTDADAADPVRTRTFVTTPGEHQLFAVADAAAPANAGLFSVNVRSSGAGALLLSHALPVGEVAHIGTAVLGAVASTLSLADIDFPMPLAQTGALVSREGVEVARIEAEGAVTFTPSAGSHQIFGRGVSGSGANGSYGIRIGPQGGTPLFADVQPVSAGGAARLFVYPLGIAAPGSYRARFADFEFPSRLIGARTAFGVTQGGPLLASSVGTIQQPLSTVVTLDLDALSSGHAFVLVDAEPPAPTPGIPAGGLFGVEVLPASGGPLFETTQGIGALFVTRKVTIADADTYRAAVSDLEFPGRFIELSVAVTRGIDDAGSIFGRGQFDFAATPGNYFVNFIARPDTLDPASAEKAGTYGITIDRKPPSPTLTLTANPSQATTGSPVTLTWTSTNATSCSASGAWNGAKATAGSEPSVAITISTTFILRCDGPGGSAERSLTVDVGAPQSDGGGGAMHWLALAVLAFAAGAGRLARRYFHSM